MAAVVINDEFIFLLLILLCSILGVVVLIFRTVTKYRSTETEEEPENQEEDDNEEQLIVSPGDSILDFGGGEEDQIDDEEEEEEEEEDDDNEEEYEEGEEFTTVEIMEPSVSSSIFHGGVINNGGDDGDSLFCSICYEAWTDNGGHQLSCLPCGHVYGLSCIKRWLQNSKKCPQCNGLCTLMDVRRLYATRLFVKSGQSLEEAESDNLEPKAAPVTVEELIDRIRNNPTIVQKIETALAQLHEHQTNEVRLFIRNLD